MLSTKFLLGDSTVNVIKTSDETMVDKLPPKVYTVQYSEFSGFYLSIIKNRMEVPKKIYGSLNARADKCLNTFHTRDTSTGILMTGDKGTGKSLLMAVLANHAIDDLNMPVIMIRQAYEGDQFISFIELLGECCLVFDEFGKTYRKRGNNDDGEKQTSLLSLLDGMDRTKRLIIMTENSMYDINDHMLNRPGRIYYHFQYAKLEEDSIVDFCIDHEVDSEVIESIVELSRVTRIFSFDMLQTIIEEHLRYPTDPISDVVKELNIDVEEDSVPEMEIIKAIADDGTEYNVVGSATVTKPSKRMGSTHVSLISKDIVKQYPETAALDVNDGLPKHVMDAIPEDGMDYLSITIAKGELKYDSKERLVYETDYGIKIVAKELPRFRRYDYRDLF